MFSKNLYILPFMFFATFLVSPKSFAQKIDLGINLTGKERIWEKENFLAEEIIDNIKLIQKSGYSSIRIPIAINHYLKTDRHFLKELQKIVKYTERNNIPLIIAYFGHDLSEKNAKKKAKEISQDWVKVMKSLKKDSKNLYIELVNEPNLNPNTWESIAPAIISDVRKVNPRIPIIIGATNFNSLFELSRTKPFSFENLIYTFHYYEPYIFTHQGTAWTGSQNATIGIPYPFQESKMPKLAAEAQGTEGEINLRDYAQTGNKTAVIDKISQIVAWANRNQVKLWCTEFGATENADRASRISYLKDVEEVLNSYQIPSFVWEWDGNFGVKGILKD
ncbi:glycoside hydrolase family 5 protein [Belliella sp. DSM 107340]|uniref:Glycoside hydrolase family 5 protein n=1 Tax=Belliella calami TaxID=2923436 RepID=A0ABS9UNH4_9BACT|nr:cellulase family glycosylhydrolase [Belliella calami]MCH7398157.1 glycoside hydrolase family 5 protein [Belliella calami]